MKSEKEYSNLERIRLEKVQTLRAEGIEPYPTRAERTHLNQEAIALFIQAEDFGVIESAPVTLVGRLRAMRSMGKVTFANIEDGSGRVQLFFRANDIGAENLKFFNQEFDLGDFVQA